MYISVRASRVVVGGLDSMAALDVGLSAVLGAPLLAGLAAWAWGWNGLLGLVVGALVHAAAAAGCRFRLVAGADGCVLYRTWLGVPWRRRAYGRRASVVVEVGWDFEELVLVPEQPEDDEDRFIVLETTMSGLQALDLDAFAAAADREIARVAGPQALRPGTYRTA